MNCSICGVEHLEEPHDHRISYEVYVWGHFYNFLQRSPWPSGDRWITSPSTATGFASLQEAREAVQEFIKQLHNPPLDDGYGTIIFAKRRMTGDFQKLEIELDRQDTVIVETEYQVLWRSRPPGAGVWNHLECKTTTIPIPHTPVEN